jgi:hypothetical protein
MARSPWLGAALVSALASCGGLVVPSSAPSSDGASASSVSGDASAAREASVPIGDAAPFTFDARGLTSCGACLAVACEDLFVQCEQSSACFDELQCAAASAAVCTCLGRDAGTTAYLALDRCERAAACGGECTPACAAGDAAVGPALCGDAADSSCAAVASSTSARCTACVTASCGAFQAACGEASDCHAYVVCLSTCSGSACLETCGNAHAAGQAAADELDVCLGANCQAECSY